MTDGCEEHIFAWGARSRDLHGLVGGFSELRSS